MADRTCLPAQRVDLELLIPSTSPAVLDESCSMPGLRLDLCRRLIFLSRLPFGDGFRSPFEILLAEFELRHGAAARERCFLGFEHYGSTAATFGLGR